MQLFFGMATGGDGVHTVAQICPRQSALMTPRSTNSPCKVILERPISNALNPYPTGPKASSAISCTLLLLMGTEAAVMTSTPALPLVLGLSLPHKLGSSCLDAFVSDCASLFHFLSHFWMIPWVAAPAPRC